MSALNVMTIKPQQAVYTLVVGLGKTGLSVVRYLHALGEAIIVVDSRDIPPGLNVMKTDFPDVRCETGAFDKALFRNAHRIVVSPGVPLSEPALVEAKHNDIEIIGDIDLFAREARAPVIGVTGSNGKSTVTALLTQMASSDGKKAIACGNIGLPVLDALDDDVDLYVTELSSFQLESLQSLPMRAAVVLNISADHMDRYESITTYALSKQRIYDGAEVLVVNKDDALARRVLAADRQVIYFTLQTPGAGELGLCTHDGVESLCFGDDASIAVTELRLKGSHNIQNALAALALGTAAGVSVEAMLETLKTFSGLAHRTQLVAHQSGVDWINDSKATNVGAAIAAMNGLSGKQVLIAGGVGKGADFTDFGKAISSHCRAVVLIGEDAPLIRNVIDPSIPVVMAESMEDAVKQASVLAQAGDNVLLAPACASFDMFDSFEQRGDCFIEAVERLLA